MINWFSWIPAFAGMTEEATHGMIEKATREINLLKKLSCKYRTQKRGLMQKLLFGEWRVNV